MFEHNRGSSNHLDGKIYVTKQCLPKLDFLQTNKNLHF